MVPSPELKVIGAVHREIGMAALAEVQNANRAVPEHLIVVGDALNLRAGLAPQLGAGPAEALAGAVQDGDRPGVSVRTEILARRADN